MSAEKQERKRKNTYDRAEDIGIIPQTPSQTIESEIECHNAGLSVGILGSPGGGKTDGRKEVARRMKKRYVVQYLNGKEPTDIGGVPYLFEDRHGVRRHGWTTVDFFQAVEDDLEHDYPGGWLWNFDDAPQAVVAMQNRIGEMLHGHTLNGVPIHPAVSIVWTGNFGTDKAGANLIPRQIPNRSIMFVQVPDVEDFCAEMGRRNRRPEIIGFAKGYPECLDSYDPGSLTNCTMRSLESVSGILDQNPHPSRELAMYCGAIGKGWGGEFYTYLRMYRDLLTKEEIVANPKHVPLPPDDRTDLLCAYAAMLGHAINRKNSSNIIEFLLRLDREYAVFALKDAARRDPTLKETRPFIEWANENGDVFA